MNDELRLLVACNLACSIGGLLLGIVHGGSALVAFTLDGPSVLVWNYVLIPAGHEISPNRITSIVFPNWVAGATGFSKVIVVFMA
jgi:hypothetical protein